MSDVIYFHDTDFDIVQEQFTPTEDLLFLYPSERFESKAQRDSKLDIKKADIGSNSVAGDGEKLNYTDMREAELKASQSIINSVSGLGERTRGILIVCTSLNIFIGIITTHIRLIVVGTRSSGNNDDLVTCYLVVISCQFQIITLLITVHTRTHTHTYTLILILILIHTQCRRSHDGNC